MIPAGFHEKKLTTMVLTLPVQGTYSFGEMAVYIQPLDERYEELAGRLAEETAENVQLHTGAEALTWATGRIDLDADVSSDRILCLQMAFSKGWKAWVDGAEAEIVPAETGFSGIRLSAGKHEVRLAYDCPGFGTGAVISLITAAVFAVLLILSRGRRVREMKQILEEEKEQENGSEEWDEKGGRVFSEAREDL